jgi:hypothetical protein
VGQQQIHVTVGFYGDLTPCEINLKSGKLGTFTNGILEGLSLSLSLAIQYGCPVQELYETFEKNYVSQIAKIKDGDCYVRHPDDLAGMMVDILEQICKGEEDVLE